MVTSTSAAPSSAASGTGGLARSVHVIQRCQWPLSQTTSRSEMSTLKPIESNSHKKATLTRPISRKSELWCRKYLHSDFISYSSARLGRRSYVHTSSSGTIPAAGTRSSLHCFSSGASAAPTRSGCPTIALRTKCSQFLTKSIITAEPKVKCNVVRRGSKEASVV